MLGGANRANRLWARITALGVGTPTQAHVYTQVHTHRHTHAGIHACTHMYTRTHTHAGIHAGMHTQVQGLGCRSLFRRQESLLQRWIL